ncbi:hypothetical protein [Pseudonocardia sp. ICBG601]|uniref:hypothetical protein n=1 Tax=Pseudonocardia sp. ICBG601 TaxID=2846759 RepID=UPI001CF61982|nr:hypothetical protein [Pseudonocardia sp. ICBG601]
MAANRVDLDLDLDLDQRYSSVGASSSAAGLRDRGGARAAAVAARALSMPGSRRERDVGDEYLPGRKFPYTTVGDWVALSGVSPRAIQAYVLLRSFVNTQRGDERAWPGQRLLARGLGVSKAHTVGAAIAELVEIGAVDVETVATATGRRNIYTVHEAPPPGYTGLASTQELAALVAAEDAEATAKALAARPAGPPPPAAETARSCPATNRATNRAATRARRRTTAAVSHDTTRSGQEPAGRRGYAAKSADPPNGGHDESLALGGYADFAADGSAEKPAQNDPKLNDPKGGGRERARTARPPRSPGPSTPPQSPALEPGPAPAAETAVAQSPIATPAADGAEAALVSELGAVTAALAQVAAQLSTTLAAHPTAAPLPTPTGGALPAIATAPDQARPDTWKCARHLAAPDPQDRPCGGCGAVRRHHEALRDLQVAEAAQKRSETAQHARRQIADCTECDEYGYVLDPHDPAGGSYDPPLRCHHDRPATDRITEDEQRRATQAAAAQPYQRSAATLALIESTRVHLLNRTSTRTSTPATTGRRRLNPKAWR